MSSVFDKSIYWDHLRSAKKICHMDELSDVANRAINEGYELIKPMQIQRCNHNAGGVVAIKEGSVAVIYHTISDKWALAVDVSTKRILPNSCASSEKETNIDKSHHELSFLGLLQDVFLDKVGRGYVANFPNDYLSKTCLYIDAKDISKPDVESDNLISLMVKEEKDGYRAIDIVQVSNAKENACILLKKDYRFRKSYKTISRRAKLWETAKIKLKTY